MWHFADRLTVAVERTEAPVCVGLDLQVDRLPANVCNAAGLADASQPGATHSDRASASARGLVAFGTEVIHLVAPFVPAVKINIAFFEAYGLEGLRAYIELVRTAHRAGLLVIADVKRADIGNTSERYAVAHLTDVEGLGEESVADAITINPYFGFDSVEPFLVVAKRTGRGLFVLVQTSNPSAVEIQGLALADGGLVCDRVGVLVQQWAAREGLVGKSGFSCVGAVVSPRDVETTRRLRTEMGRCIFLVPGFGAQGRSAEEVATCFHAGGRGAIVNASRSVVYAHAEPRYRDRFQSDWHRCIAESCKDFVNAIRTVAPLR